MSASPLRVVMLGVGIDVCKVPLPDILSRCDRSTLRGFFPAQKVSLSV